MARRRGRFRRHRRGSHAARKWFGIAGKIIGGTVVAMPAITAVGNNLKNGNPGNIPHDILENYTGVDATTGAFYSEHLMGGIASIVGGLVLIKVFSMVGKHF